MSDAPPASPASEPSPGSSVQGGAPLSLSPQQVMEALGAAREVLGGCRVERVLELSDKVTVAKIILDAVLRGELVLGRAQPSGAPPGAARLPKPGNRPKPRRG